jgi:hypothetical protein
MPDEALPKNQRSCDSVCEKLGMVCNEAGFHFVPKHTHQLTNKYYMRELSIESDHIFNKFNEIYNIEGGCTYEAGSHKHKFHPSFHTKSGSCYLAGSDRLSTCQAKSKSDFRRLCPCSASGDGNE